MRFRQGVMVAAFAAAAAVPAGAQVVRDTAQLEPVVVTANRMATPRAAVPAAVTVLDGAELSSRGIRSVGEALRNVAGVEIVQNGSYGGVTSAFVRGGESDYLKVLVDGVPVNAPGGAVDLADLTTDNIDRIEIVRGPVSVLYGSDAVSGVVQIFTKRGDGALHGDVSVRAGTHASLDAVGGLAGGTEVVQYSVAAARTRTDGIYEFNNEYANTVWSGAVGVHPDARTDAQVTLRYGEGRYHYPTDGVGAVVDANAFQRREQLLLGLEAGRYLSRGVEARAAVTVNRMDGAIDDQPDSPADTVGFFGYSSAQTASRQGADVRINAFLPAGASATVGGAFEWQREQTDDETLSEYGPSSSRFDAKRTNGAVYAQLQAEPLSGVALTAGGRLDDNSAFGTFFSYRGGASYRLPNGLTVRASIGRGFKEPTFFETFADGPFARGNPALRPERSRSWEAGFDQSVFSRRVTVSGTYFDQRFVDLVEYVFAPTPEDPNFVNVAAASANGFEAELKAEVPLAVRITGAYTYVRARVTEAGTEGGAMAPGTRLLRRPEHAASLGMAKDLWGRGWISATVRYTGKRDDLDFSAFPSARVTLPAHTRVDMALDLTVLAPAGGRPSVALTARLQNAFDVEYQEVHGFRTPGRVVAVGMRVGI